MSLRLAHGRRAVALGFLMLLAACSVTIESQQPAAIQPTLSPREQATLVAQQYAYNQALLRPLPNAPLQIRPSGVPSDGTLAAAQPTSGAQPTGDVAAGQQLFVRLGCIGCHRMEANVTGPPLQRVYGSQVRLQSGQVVTADEAYIRNSILNPASQVVANYPAVMPSYQGRVTEQELAQLVAYIRALATQPTGQ